MKSCNEMTSSVFMRIEEYRNTKKKTNKQIVKTIIPVLGICLGVLIGVAAQYREKVKNVENASISEIGESDSIIESENIIIVNEIEAIPAGKMYICLLREDFVQMDKEELIGYYGADIFPKIPDDLTEWDIENDSASYGIFRRNGGTGEVYHDVTVLNYSNEDTTRHINIEIAKGKFPFTCYGDFGYFSEYSVIGGVKVGIGQSDNGLYLVEFMNRNVGFRMITDGLSIEETEAVIESLIHQPLAPSDEGAVTVGD